MAENYRSISVLPVFSKILEKIMYNRVYNYFAKKSFFSQNNLAFKLKLKLNMQSQNQYVILLNPEKKSEYALGVFIDLKKAFDTVNHEIRLHKLKLYGINGTCLESFKSYLSNQNQCIVYNVYNNIEKSVLLDILCGVTQVPILAPLLFLIYLNDLYKFLEKLNPIIFADDTNLFPSGLNVDDLFSDMNCEPNKIFLWFKANKLSLNLTNRKYSLFHPASKR